MRRGRRLQRAKKQRVVSCPSCSLPLTLGYLPSHLMRQHGMLRRQVSLTIDRFRRPWSEAIL